MIPHAVIFSRVFLVCGFLSGFSGIVAFRRKGTTIDPKKPQKASHLVREGIYQWTRNPMYLGMLLILIGGAIRTGSPFGILPIFLFIFYMTRFQIIPEEKALKKRFGSVYEDYCRKVRRWI